MKIRLILPAHMDQQGNTTRFDKLFLPNLSLPTLAGLTPDGIDVGITLEYVEDIDFDEDVDLVGVTGQTCQAPRAYQIADEFRKRGIKTVMGGIHASACPEEALKHFDSVVIGEAEDLWEPLLEDARAGRLQRTYECRVKPDLQRLVIPKFSKLDYSQFIVPPFAKTPLLPFQATRGCPNRCDFCSVSKFFGNKIRKKPVKNIVREIEAAEPSRIFFTDDNIIADPKHSKELFAALKPLKTRFACQISTRVLKHPELIKAAAEAGCHECFIGIESLNEANLKSISKTFNKAGEYAEIMTRLADVGILPQVSVIVGLDEDTPDTLLRMVESILKWDVIYMYVTVLTPLPATPLYDRMVSEKRILTDDWSQYDLLNIVVDPVKMTVSEQNKVVWDMYERFYSLKSSTSRFWRLRKQFTKYFPRDNAVEEAFFHSHIRRAIKQKRHPFTLGMQKQTRP
jgi:radical SAM superfamily enzyme YgiQ (UPF0313 family)